MSYSNNKNDLSGECFRKPFTPPPPNNRTAWKKIQATWDACFLGAQASKVQALALTLFSALDWFPESLLPSDIMLAAAVRWEHSRESCFTVVAFLMLSFEQIQGSRHYRLECVCCSSAVVVGVGWGGENEEKKNTERVFLCLLSKLQWQHGSRLLMPLTLQRSRSVRNWSFFLCLNLWLMYQRNTEATGLARQNTLWVSRRWELCFLRIRVCKTHEKLGSACLSKLPSIFPALLPN